MRPLEAPWPSFQACTLKLPRVKADPVKLKRLDNCLDTYFVFDLVGLNWLAAQRARLAGPETAPKPRRLLAGQLSPGETLAGHWPQLSFEFREQQVSPESGGARRCASARNCPVAACRHPQDPTVKLQEAGVRRTTKLGRLARGGFPRHRQAHLAAERSRPGGWN